MKKIKTITIDANSFPGIEFGRSTSTCMHLHEGPGSEKFGDALPPWNGGQADRAEICPSPLLCVILPKMLSF